MINLLKEKYNEYTSQHNIIRKHSFRKRKIFNIYNFCYRLANDVKTKTPFDIRINTNRKDLFEEDERVSVRDDFFKDHYTHVGAFNQLLKFSAIQQVDKKYDWVLYLDCDAGFTDNIHIDFMVLEMNGKGLNFQVNTFF